MDRGRGCEKTGNSFSELDGREEVQHRSDDSFACDNAHFAKHTPISVKEIVVIKPDSKVFDWEFLLEDEYLGNSNMANQVNNHGQRPVDYLYHMERLSELDQRIVLDETQTRARQMALTVLFRHFKMFEHGQLLHDRAAVQMALAYLNIPNDHNSYAYRTLWRQGRKSIPSIMLRVHSNRRNSTIKAMRVSVFLLGFSFHHCFSHSDIFDVLLLFLSTDKDAELLPG